MYLQHFRLNELPFSITPNTSFFMNRAGYQDALNVLLVALRSGEGFVKVTGEVGVGKTILCRKLMNSLGADYVIAYIHNPYIRPDSLLLAIADALGVPYTERISQHTLLKLLTGALLNQHRNGRHVVVCLDEVQAMPVQTLESLRLLTNLETEDSKLIQVVLFGQPELDALLNQPSVRQLKQRITFAYRLLPLNKVAMAAYIRHRLEIAGYHGRNLFARKAIEYVYRHSNGIPRLINIICHKALISAYGEGSATVTHKHVAAAVADMEEMKQHGQEPLKTWAQMWYRWLFGALGMAGLIYAGGYFNSLLGLIR
jgi:MSHA biogenesis protein MshM